MQWYRQALLRALNKEIDFDSDLLTFTLHTSAYAYNLDTNSTVADLTNELPTGGGYTAGGLGAGTLTRTYTAAASWATARANSTAYALNDILRPSASNGFLYRVAAAGTTGGAPPTFPTVVGTTVVDGGVTLECVGSGIIVLSCGSPSWPTFGATFRTVVLSDRTPAGAGNQPLLGLTDFGGDQVGLGGTLTINVSPSVPNLGVLYIAVP